MQNNNQLYKKFKVLHNQVDFFTFFPEKKISIGAEVLMVVQLCVIVSNFSSALEVLPPRRIKSFLQLNKQVHFRTVGIFQLAHSLLAGSKISGLLGSAKYTLLP
jgi:hypothetical protein